jgi:hypothetical protein
MKIEQINVLDKSKYQKIKSGFVTALSEARKHDPANATTVVQTVFETLSSIDSFLDETAATGHFLQECMDGHPRILKHTTIHKLNESFRSFAGLNVADRESVVKQLTLSIAVEQLRMSGKADSQRT